MLPLTEYALEFPNNALWDTLNMSFWKPLLPVVPSLSSKPLLPAFIQHKIFKTSGPEWLLVFKDEWPNMRQPQDSWFKMQRHEYSMVLPFSHDMLAFLTYLKTMDFISEIWDINLCAWLTPNFIKHMLGLVWMLGMALTTKLVLLSTDLALL